MAQKLYEGDQLCIQKELWIFVLMHIHKVVELFERDCRYVLHVQAVRIPGARRPDNRPRQPQQFRDGSYKPIPPGWLGPFLVRHCIIYILRPSDLIET